MGLERRPAPEMKIELGSATPHACRKANLEVPDLIQLGDEFFYRETRVNGHDHRMD